MSVGKVLVIPDIHNRFGIAEAIIGKENPDQIIFLGDYFDSFGDESDVETVSNTAKWLSQSVQKSNRIHLFGNHDLWYSHGSGYPYCSGNSHFKLFVIRQFFNDWHKLKFHCWVDDWLCTHAGLSNRVYRQYQKEYSVLELMNYVEQKGRTHPLVSLCGEARGGIEGEAGGILWCDYSEFEDIPKIKQIFGHTNGELRHLKTKGSEHYCIDTGLRYYGIFEKGLKIKKVQRPPLTPQRSEN